MTQEERSSRKTAIGWVISDKMQKTRVIEIRRSKQHSHYEKVLRRFTKVYAHDEENKSHVGDKVLLAETRHVSKAKTWRILEILSKQ